MILRMRAGGVFLAIFPLVFLIAGVTAVADDAPRVVALVAPIERGNSPREGVMILRINEHEFRVVEGTLIKGNQTLGPLHAGAIVEFKELPSSLEYFFMGEGDSGHVISPLVSELPPYRVGSLSEITDKLAAETEILKELQHEAHNRDLKIRALRAEVDALADLGRILELRVERKKIENSLAAFDVEEKMLKDSLRELQRQGFPVTYRAKEQSLLRSLALMNSVNAKSPKNRRKIQRENALHE